jgi:chemotaxis protein MotB
MARKKHHDEGHENSERWLLTYSDMITLLMAFFIMMYSMSVLNLAKFNQVAFSIRSGFGGMLKGGDHLLNTPAGDPTMVNLNPMGETKSTKDSSGRDRASSGMQKKLRAAEEKISNYLQQHDLDGKVIVSQETRGMVITIVAEGVLFPRGSAELSDTGLGLLGVVTDMITATGNHVMVEGHTCNLPIASSVFPSNWELSAARASRVVRAFINRGVSPRRLSAIGYAETRPLVPNDTEEHRVYNRRVNIVLMNEDFRARTEPTPPETLEMPQAGIIRAKPDVKPALHPIRNTGGEK